jgi:hypothetical protein
MERRPPAPLRTVVTCRRRYDEAGAGEFANADAAALDALAEAEAADDAMAAADTSALRSGVVFPLPKMRLHKVPTAIAASW